METIPLVSKYLELFRSGSKTTTVRRGRRDPELGPVELSDGESVEVSEIVEIRHLRLERLTDQDAVNDGFGSKSELLEALQEFYPDLGEEDEVTILVFGGDRVSG